VRDMTFKTAYWPSLRTTARPALLAERDTTKDWAAGDPQPGWRYRYRMPSDCILPRFVNFYARFEVVRDELHTNLEDPVLVYSGNNVDIGHWDTELVDLIVSALGVRLAAALPVDNARYQKARDQFRESYARALTMQANTSHLPLPETIPEWLAARNSAYMNYYDRELPPFLYENYFYPTSAMQL
jgi:hypothetical protein